MAERCAVCGAEDIWKRVALPDAWVTYLVEERDVEPAEGYYLLPACNDCSGEVDMQKALDEAMAEMDDDTTELLDELEPAALVDETGGDEA